MNAVRRKRSRLVFRDLAAAAAFGSMAVSGELPIWGVALTLIAFLVALSGRRPLARHGTASAVALLLCAGGIYLSVAAGGIDLVVAASTFAGLITGQRILSEPAPSTDNQVHLTSLLMIAGGAALSGDLLFGLTLSLFAVCIALSLGLGVLEQASAGHDELKVSPAVRQIGVGALFAVLGGVLFFVLFPRLNWNVAARHMPRGLGSESGLSTTIRLGATGGSIKTTARVVARVKLTPDPKKKELDRYFVASRLTKFDGRGWDGPTQVSSGRPGVNLYPDVETAVTQQYELLPGYGAPIAIALSPPIAFFNAYSLHAGGPPTRLSFQPVKGREIRFSGNGNGYTYTAWSAKSAVPEQPGEREAALTLPEKLDPRITSLALQLKGTETDPSRIANRIQDYLTKNYAYTLELPGPVDDPLADFLFARKKGHCEFFATALTVLLRSAGVPARVAVGFYGGVRNGDHYILRAGDAHAWTEVLTKDGFVTFDATPESGRRAQSASIKEWLIDTYEQVESWWSRSVVDYSFRDQFDFARRLFDAKAALSARTGLQFPDLRRIFATLAAGVLAYALMRALMGRKKAGPRHEATLLFEELQRVLGRAGVTVAETDDLAEVAKALKAAAHPLAPEVSRISRRYLEARFGPKPLREGERQALVAALERAVKANAAGYTRAA